MEAGIQQSGILPSDPLASQLRSITNYGPLVTVSSRSSLMDTDPSLSVHLSENQDIPAVTQMLSSQSTEVLNPEAATFHARDVSLVHRGRMQPDLDGDWAQVQQVQAGGVGEPGSAGDLWKKDNIGSIGLSGKYSTSYQENTLPFQLLEDFSEILSTAPKQIHKIGKLADLPVQMPAGVFTDKALPAPGHVLKENETYTGNYYIALHNVTAAPGIRGDGSSYEAYTPNHIGARIALPHVKLKLSRWRYHLVGYEDAELLQFLEYGFPVGLSSLPDLECSSRNHGSAYMWYDFVDKFISTEVVEGGLSGPVERAPWWNTVISPVMTAHKKIKSRRTVFDATFGDKSLNNLHPRITTWDSPANIPSPRSRTSRT